MRKLLLLAVAIGAAELVKRRAAKAGISPTALISAFVSSALLRLKGEPQDTPA